MNQVEQNHLIVCKFELTKFELLENGDMAGEVVAADADTEAVIFGHLGILLDGGDEVRVEAAVRGARVDDESEWMAVYATATDEVVVVGLQLDNGKRYVEGATHNDHFDMQR